MPETNPYTEFYWFLGVVAFLVLVLIIAGLISFVEDFTQELKYLNMEIRRTEGAERQYWKRQRKRFWLSLIPFVKY